MAYSIGNFTFETEEEFNKANEELQFINELKKQYNINDKDDAQKILDYLEANNKTFETSIGSWFIKMLDKKGGVNMGTRKPKAATETQGERPATTQKAEAAGTGKASKTSKPMSTKTKAVTSESDADTVNVSRLEKRINLLIVLVIILLIITIVQEIQLLINNSSQNNNAQVNIGNNIDLPVQGSQAAVTGDLAKGDIQDILLLASYLGQTKEDVVRDYNEPYKAYEDDKAYYFKSVYCRGYDGELCVWADKKTGKINYVEWSCKRIVNNEPERIEKLNVVTQELTGIFDKIYVATGTDKWRTDFGNIQLTNSGQRYLIEMTNN